MDEVTLFESTPAKLREHGPFDVILAMSVLCRFPESLERERLQFTDLYSFGDFERMLGVLSGVLRPGGLLCLFNTHYNFLQSQVAEGYRIVASPLIATNGFVDKFDANGDRVTWCEKVGPHYVHRLRWPPDLTRKADFVNCIFEKTGGGGEPITVPVRGAMTSTVGRRPEMFRFGPDLKELAASGLVGTALGYWFDQDELGHRIVRAWHHTTPDGRIEHHDLWAVRADATARSVLVAPPLALPAAPPPAMSERMSPLVGARRLVGQIQARLTGQTLRRAGPSRP